MPPARCKGIESDGSAAAFSTITRPGTTPLAAGAGASLQQGIRGEEELGADAGAALQQHELIWKPLPVQAETGSDRKLAATSSRSARASISTR